MKSIYTQFEDELEGLLGIGAIEEWQAFGPGHYRINGELDVWPKNRRYYTKDLGKSRQYRDIEQLLLLIF